MNLKYVFYIISITLAMQLGVLCLPVSAVHADEYDDAVSEYNSGNFDAAYTKLLPIAKSGNEQAQLYLGEMYAGGYGVGRDYAMAKRWYTMSAMGGDGVAQYRLGGDV